MIVSQESYIEEHKDIKYKTMTFSGYKRSQVVSALKKSITKQEIDRACKWGAELDISTYKYNLSSYF